MSDLDFSHLSPADLQIALAAPALTPPDGVTPNFDDPPNLNGVSLAGLLVCLIVATIFLCIRIYVKFWKLRQWHLADFLMIIAYAFYLVVLVGSVFRVVPGSDIGLFVHQWNVRGEAIKVYLLKIFIGIEFWLGAILLVKTAILLEWLRIFAPTRSQPFTLSCKLLISITVVFYTAGIIALNVTCQPFQKNWDKTLPGHCIDIKRIHFGAVIVNLLLDFAILILPQPVIWSLQMTTTRKIGVSTVFAIGILAIIAAGFLVQSVADWIATKDMVYYYSGVALWGIAEITCGILVFCVPFTPRLFRGLGLSSWLVSNIPEQLSSIRAPEWLQKTTDSERQSRSRGTRDYHELDDAGNIHLRGYGSPRPTDRQYGIAVTTDIVVTETFEPPYDKLEDSQHPWIAQAAQHQRPH
ncbi:hypothetical protein F5Y18DRAFT_261077 [Xylariaceae sp. FL1019]|nr:hypothetical protein F5Y18DRAFT_261077 [Xylariaceae sp. FL1019]